MAKMPLLSPHGRKKDKIIPMDVDGDFIAGLVVIGTIIFALSKILK
jgi:hypothetical protein